MRVLTMCLVVISHLEIESGLTQCVYICLLGIEPSFGYPLGWDTAFVAVLFVYYGWINRHES